MVTSLADKITLVDTPKGLKFIIGDGTYDKRATIKALGFKWDRNSQQWQKYGDSAAELAKALGLTYKETIPSKYHGQEIVYDNMEAKAE